MILKIQSFEWKRMFGKKKIPYDDFFIEEEIPKKKSKFKNKKKK